MRVARFSCAHSTRTSFAKRFVSELQFQAELQNPGIARSCQTTEGAGCKTVRSRRHKIRMVQKVEELRPELDAQRLPNREHLCDCDVDVLEVGTRNNISACGPESSWFVLGEGFRVEPFSYGVAVRVLARTSTDVADEICVVEAHTG